MPDGQPQRYGDPMSEVEGHGAAARRFAPPQFVNPALIIVAIGLPIVSIAAGADAFGPGFGIEDVVAAVLGVALILLRHRAPRLTLAVAVLSTALLVAGTGHRSLLFAAVVLLLYTVAVDTDRRTTVVAGTLSAVVLAIVSVVFIDTGFSAEAFGLVAWCGMATAVGDAVRNQRAYLAAVEERARRAEATREEEARRRVVEERLRIARELHDLVAHRMAVINVQAGVASHVLATQPVEAEQALRIVREAASEVLGELGEMLSVLRNTDDPEAPVDPTPTLQDLGALVESFASAGLDVTWESTGTIDGIPESVQLTLFRLVQEGLTNAQRYGDGKALLRIERSPTGVHLTIENHRAAALEASAGSGYGLVGMRERVAAIGGTIEIGATGDSSFSVAAQLPIRSREASP